MLEVLERTLELARHRREVAAFDDPRLPAPLAPAPDHLAQERALADAGAAVDEHDRHVALTVEQAVEEGKLAPAADEPVLVRVGETTGERPWHPGQRIRVMDADGRVHAPFKPGAERKLRRER
jgi:hypothetical protein